MTEKLCVFCDHLDMEGDTGGEYGEPAKFFCTKGRWSGARAKKRDSPFDRHMANEIRIWGGDALEEFRAVIRFAEQCADYSPPKPKAA